MDAERSLFIVRYCVGKEDLWDIGRIEKAVWLFKEVP
jgi:hypothetical protein